MRTWPRRIGGINSVYSAGRCRDAPFSRAAKVVRGESSSQPNSPVCLHRVNNIQPLAAAVSVNTSLKRKAHHPEHDLCQKICVCVKLQHHLEAIYCRYEHGVPIQSVLESFFLFCFCLCEMCKHLSGSLSKEFTVLTGTDWVTMMCV